MKNARVWGPLLLIVGAIMLAGCASGLFGVAPEPVTLRFGYRAHTLQAEQLLDGFQDQYPHISVEPVEVDRWGNALRQQVSQGQLDLIREGREALGYAQQSLLRPLDEMQLAEWAEIRDDYYAGAWDALRMDGQQWGIPAGIDMMVLYANMDAMRALGVALPDTGQPWDAFAFLELASALNHPEGTAHDPAASLFGFCTNPNEWDPFMFVYLWGGRIVDDLNNPQRPTLDQPETVKAVHWYTELFTRYGVAPDPGLISRTFPMGGYYEAQMTGHCGLWLGLYSNRGGLDTPSRWTSDWEMLPLPHDGEALNMADVQGYFVTQSSAHPQEALLLARYLSEQWQASGSQLPPRRSLAANPAYAQAVGERVAAQAQGLSGRVIIVPAELSPEIEQVGGAVLEIINRSIREGDDVVPLLQEAQQRLERSF